MVDAWEAEGDDESEDDFYVYPVNSDAVRVFRLCRWKRIPLTTMEGIRLLYDSIDAGEIESVADMIGVPHDNRQRMLAGVRVMEEVALSVLNEM